MHTPPILELRQIELGDRCVEVLAPVGWTDAQTEAWREVLGGTADIGGAVTALAREIAQAAQSEDSSKEPEGKTEMLNAVLDSLPEAEPTQKPKRRRVTSAARAPQSSDSSENSEQ
jgi:hypothetical protein